MADKSISELTAASAVGSSDLFVLEQTGVAKKLTGQILENWLVSFADGHGGIQSIVKTGSSGTNPVIDTYTITLADTTTFAFTVTNGLKGDTGQAWYLWIKYAAQRPTADSQIYDQSDDWIGIYSGTASTAPTSYQAYTWFNWKGEQGDQGEAIGSVVRTSGDGSPGTTDVYQMRLEDGTVVGTFDVYQGMDGSGTVSSVDNVSVAPGTTNVPLGAVRYSAAQSLTSAQQAQARENMGLLDYVYPVGSIYMSANSTSPGTLFGGTWERIQDTFLLAAGSTYAAGSTGGEATHTLTVDEMPSHMHKMSVVKDAATGNVRWRPVSWGEGTTESATERIGGGQAHNNMPPYLAVYVWKRTA